MKILFKSLLLLFYLFLFFSCGKDDAENLDKTNQSILISEKWYGPIETEYFYYDENNNEVRNSIDGIRDTFTFDFQEDETVLFTISGYEKIYDGNWELNNSKLLVTSNNEEYYSLSPTWIVIDFKIISINSSEMILERMVDTQEEGISYAKAFVKYISIE